jgi:hypothetical protein
MLVTPGRVDASIEWQERQCRNERLRLMLERIKDQAAEQTVHIVRNVRQLILTMSRKITNMSSSARGMWIFPLNPYLGYAHAPSDVAGRN